ncbi:MAG: hypothetical protein Q9195_007229 [Heterodermia aff. obscurata]
MSVYQNCSTILAAFILYSASIALYRLFFHPLARFPGPKLAAATKWYEFWFDLMKAPGGTFMHEIERMHSVYGPIVRINPAELHVKDSDWFGTLYTGPTSATVAISEDMIYEKVDLLTKNLNEKLGNKEVVELRQAFLALTTDTLSQHAFERSTNLLENGKAAADWKRTIKAVAILTPLVKQFTWIIPLALKLPLTPLRWLVPDLARIVALRKSLYNEAQKAIEDIVIDQPLQVPIESQIPAPTVTSNIFKTILSSRHLSREEKERDRITQEAFVVLVAGGETTARVITTASYHLLANKGTALLRLKQELATLSGNVNSRLEVKVLEQLPYLTAVVKESLRITALVTSRLPLVSPLEPLRYDKWVLPVGTPVSMTLRDVLLDPSIFVKPLAFEPERWLSGNPDLQRINQAYVPFGKGSRMCVGLKDRASLLHIEAINLLTARPLSKRPI